MDTNIGTVSLTDKQASRVTDLKSGIICGFSYHREDDSVVVVSTRTLTAGEISSLRADLEALPDEYTQEYLIRAFNVEDFQSDLLALMPTVSNVNLRLEYGALNTFATNRDFEGMQSYLDFLVENEIATPGDVAAVLELLTKQGIIL